jgi:GntR family transcriptional regulator / MocR family aminotransferase
VIKRAAGWFIQGRLADTADTRPWRVRIHAWLVEGIRGGQLPPGSRLPSARQLAAEWGVSRGTVDEAFAWLQADGWIERRVGRGSVVAAALPATATGSVAPGAPARREPTAAALRALARLKPISDDPSDYPLHGQRGLWLRAQMTDVSRFPLPLWRRLLARAHAETQRERLSYGPAAGTVELRTAAAQHLALVRALRCTPRQLIVVESVLQGLSLVAQVLLEAGAPVCVCEPGHVSTARFFSLLHHPVHGIVPDEQGFDVQAARRAVARPAAIVVQPGNQYPSGGCMGPLRRQELLQWADETGAWIVEHEFLGEVAYHRAHPPPLWAEDQRESVILLGSFSPIMFPSLRLAYLVVPERLAGAFAAVRGMLGDHSPVAPQLALAQFITEGHMASHVRVMRELYARRRDTLAVALQAHPLLAAGLRQASAGVNSCLHLGAAWPDHALLPALVARRVAPSALSLSARHPGPLNGLVLGFGADEEADIRQAVAQLAAVVQGWGGAGNVG